MHSTIAAAAGVGRTRRLSAAARVMRPARIGAVLMACLIAAGCTEIKTATDKLGAEVSSWFGGTSLYSKMTREDVRLASDYDAGDPGRGRGQRAQGMVEPPER